MRGGEDEDEEGGTVFLVLSACVSFAVLFLCVGREGEGRAGCISGLALPCYH